MAKKQSLSYGPNTGLIAGEAAVAGSEAGLTNVGGAFAQGFTNVFAAYQKEEEERAAKMEAYAAQFPGLEQSNFMANATNKQIVTDFLNTQRDEFVRLAAIHEKTGDRKVLDQMNAIKFSITNLNDQIKVFNQDKQEYRTAFDEDQLAAGKTYEADFFTNIYTDNAKFTITPNGDISFDVGGKKNTSKLYKDHAGNWLPSNNVSEANFLEVYSKAVASGEKGNAFYRDTTYRALLSNLKSTGNDGLQTFITTDLTGDKSEFTFEQQWASGNLDDKFYKGRGKAGQENNTDWMFDNKNANEVRKLVADYYTDVVKSGYDMGKKNYKPPKSGTDTTKNPERLGFEYNTNSTGYDDAHPDESKRTAVFNVGFGSLVKNRNILLPKNVVKGSEIQGEHYVYRFNGDTWQAFYEGEKIKDVKGSQIAQWEGLLSPFDTYKGDGLPMFDMGTASAKQSQEEEAKKPLTPGGIGISAIESNNINDVRRSIQDVFNNQFAKDFSIVPFFKTTRSLESKQDIKRVVKNKIKIKGPGGFEKVYEIGKNATNEIADQITQDIIGVSDYRKQDPFLIKQ
tara:strand:- start:36 stop:1736 length:1701 start_codon:yes stop_codon:yes gene_type:complete